MSLQFQPMPLPRRKSAFNHSDFIFEVKWDGFRSLALIEHGRTQLISRNGHRFASFADLEKLISAGLPDTTAVARFAHWINADGQDLPICSSIVGTIRASSPSIC
jgi:hypothetical protein